MRQVGERYRGEAIVILRPWERLAVRPTGVDLERLLDLPLVDWRSVSKFDFVGAYFGEDVAYAGGTGPGWYVGTARANRNGVLGLLFEIEGPDGYGVATFLPLGQAQRVVMVERDSHTKNDEEAFMRHLKEAAARARLKR
jgi:hypothetical protein